MSKHLHTDRNVPLGAEGDQRTFIGNTITHAHTRAQTHSPVPYGVNTHGCVRVHTHICICICVHVHPNVAVWSLLAVCMSLSISRCTQGTRSSLHITHSHQKHVGMDLASIRKVIRQETRPAPARTHAPALVNEHRMSFVLQHLAGLGVCLATSLFKQCSSQVVSRHGCIMCFIATRAAMPQLMSNATVGVERCIRMLQK